jgi:hypothetical protein
MNSHEDSKTLKCTKQIQKILVHETPAGIPVVNKKQMEDRQTARLKTML